MKRKGEENFYSHRTWTSGDRDAFWEKKRGALALTVEISLLVVIEEGRKKKEVHFYRERKKEPRSAEWWPRDKTGPGSTISPPQQRKKGGIPWRGGGATRGETLSSRLNRRGLQNPGKKRRARKRIST